MEQYDYLSLIFAIGELLLSCLFVANGCVLWLSCVKYLSLRNYADMKSFIRLRNIGLLFIGSCSLGFLLLGIANIIDLMDENSDLNHVNKSIFTLSAFANFFFDAGIIIDSFFLITRLHQAFKDTAYSVSKKIIKIMVVLTSVLSIIFVTFGGTRAFQYGSFNLNHDITSIGQIILSFVWIILVLQQIYISYLFSSKLFIIALHTHQKSTIKKDVMKTSKMLLNEKQNQLLTVIAKQTLLSRIVSSALLILVVLQLLDIVLDTLWFEVSADILFYGYLICLSITMQLSFVFRDKWYYRCCSKCHHVCIKYYQKIAIEKLELGIESDSYSGGTKKNVTNTSQECAMEMQMTNECAQFEYVELST